MKTTDTTIDDIADSITALGTMMGEQLVGLETRLTIRIERLEVGQTKLEAGLNSLDARQDKMETGLNHLTDGQTKLEAGQGSIMSELAEIRREQRVMNDRLSNLEGKVEGLHSDIKEIYDRIVSLERKLNRINPAEYLATRRELRILKAWAVKVSAQTGVPMPKF